LSAAILDKFLVFSAAMDGEVRVTQKAKAEMRVKYGFEQSIYHLRLAINNRVVFANNIPVICPSDRLKMSWNFPEILVFWIPFFCG